MSHNQLRSRGDKYEIPQYRRRSAVGRSGSSTTQRNFSTVGGGGAGKTDGIEPLLHTSSASYLTTTSESKIISGEETNNVQEGGKFSSSTARASCGSGDPSKSLQFGSISPGFMNGMEIRARANSAPQNMDEQTRYQVCILLLSFSWMLVECKPVKSLWHDNGAALTSPTPSVYKLQWRKKDAQAVDQSNPIEPHSILKEKLDVHVPAPHVTTQTHEPFGHPVSGVSMPTPFHQPEAPVQCGDVKPQMQSVGTANSSTPMTIPTPLRMGNPPLVQQQVFVPGIQPHPMLPHGTMHQDQGPLISPQMGNMGMSRGPRYQQQQAGKYGGPPKTEKITRNDLSEGFVITSDTIEALTASNVNASRGSYPSPGRVVDRPARGPTVGRGSSCIGEDDKCGLEAQGQDLRLDIDHGGNVQGLRCGIGRNYGLTKDLCEKPPIRSGPMQSRGLQRGMQLYKINSDRWQHTPSFHKGTTTFPQFPLQVMHKSSRKHEEEAKQRQLKGILDKLTPHNMEKVLYQIERVNIDNANTLYGLTDQIYFKAVMKPTFCDIYVNLCHQLAGKLRVFSEDNEKITFKRLLLNICQYEFERGGREQEDANSAEEGEVKQPEVEKEEKRINVHAQVRKLGNIQYIGELYKKRMVTERLVHYCIRELLGECHQHHGEEDIEGLCKLMTTVGDMMVHPTAKEHMDTYFEMMSKLSDNMKLSSRTRFLLKDVVDQRRNNWKPTISKNAF